MRACILIKTVPTAAETILERIKTMSGVTKAYYTYGRWDVVAFIDTPAEEIGKISANVNLIDGVRSTETLPET